MYSNARIYIVDDEMMAINYFKMLCEQASPTYEVVGEAYNGVEALPRILEMNPDIVFIDISMPLMDGIELGKRIVKQNPQQKIIFLTSYRDFEYAKTGLDIGVSAYLLKNELSTEVLVQEVEKIMSIVKNEQTKNRTYLEYNIRNFLAADMDMKEDYIYQKRMTQKYALLYIFQNIPIGLRGIEMGYDKIDCRYLEQQNYGSGVCCRNTVNTGDGKWCIILFLDASVGDYKNALKTAAKRTLEIFRQNGIDCRCIASSVTSKFLELSQIYKKLDHLRLYFYAYSENQILFGKDLEAKRANSLNVNPFMQEIRVHLKEDNKELLQKSMEEFLTKAKENLNIYDYTNIYINLCSMIKQWVEEKGLDPALLEVQENFSSVKEAETNLWEWLDMIFEAYKNKKNVRYSKKIELALEYIYYNYNKNISLIDIAEAVNLSESHLRKLFKNETGETVVDFLTAYRIEKAKKMIKDGKEKMNEISHKVGFTSNQYFTYVFKKLEGITPGEYLKKEYERNK